MMSGQSSEELIQRIVDKLVAEYAPQQVILFGSYAYGTPDRDSDIDLLIIKETEEPFIERVAEARRAMAGTHENVPTDILVMTPAEISVRLGKGDHFIEDIVGKGRSLYGEASWKGEGHFMTGEEPTYAMEWLTNAERDMRLVGLILESEEDPYGAGFHLQQALEKALKAFLLYNGWRLQRTHNLATLLDASLPYDAGVASYRSLCDQVSEYYIAERYPDSGLVGPGIAEVKDNLAAARELVEKIREVIT